MGQRACIFDPNKPEKKPTAREVRAKKRKLPDPEPSEENSDAVEEISETVEEMEYENECASIFKCSVALEHSYCKEESSETEQNTRPDEIECKVAAYLVDRDRSVRQTFQWLILKRLSMRGKEFTMKTKSIKDNFLIGALLNGKY